MYEKYSFVIVLVVVLLIISSSFNETNYFVAVNANSVMENDPLFSISTATIGDNVTIYANITDPQGIDFVIAFPAYQFDVIDAFSMTFNSTTQMYEATFTVGNGWPTPIQLPSFYIQDLAGNTLSLVAGLDYNTPTLNLFSTNPDFSPPNLLAGEGPFFIPQQANHGELIEIVANFSDFETGIKTNWASTIEIGTPTQTYYFPLFTPKNFTGNSAFYIASFILDLSLTTENLMVKTLWSKNGVGITKTYLDGTDYFSPLLQVNASSVPTTTTSPVTTSATGASSTTSITSTSTSTTNTPTATTSSTIFTSSTNTNTGTGTSTGTGSSSGTSTSPNTDTGSTDPASSSSSTSGEDNPMPIKSTDNNSDNSTNNDPSTNAPELDLPFNSIFGMLGIAILVIAPKIVKSKLSR